MTSAKPEQPAESSAALPADSRANEAALGSSSATPSPAGRGEGAPRRPVPDRSQFLATNEDSTTGDSTGGAPASRYSVQKLVAGLIRGRLFPVRQAPDSAGADAAAHHAVHGVAPGKAMPPALASVLLASSRGGETTVASTRKALKRRAQATAAVAGLMLMIAFAAGRLLRGSPDQTSEAAVRAAAAPNATAAAPPPSPGLASPHDPHDPQPAVAAAGTAGTAERPAASSARAAALPRKTSASPAQRHDQNKVEPSPVVNAAAPQSPKIEHDL